MNKTVYVGETTGRQQGFARKLLKSYLLVASIGLVMLMIALSSTYYLRTKIIVLAEQGGPIAQASSHVLVGVQRSLAGLRGWVSLGDEEFLDEWKGAWVEGIEPAMTSVMKYRDVLKKTEGEELLNQLPSLLTELKASQW